MDYHPEYFGAVDKTKPDVDSEFQHMWLKGNRERFVQRQAEFWTEILPKELNRLDKAIKAFSKIKLNERGLPF